MLASISPLGERARVLAVGGDGDRLPHRLGPRRRRPRAARRRGRVAAAGVVAGLPRRARSAPPSCCSPGCCWTGGWAGSGCRPGTARSTSGGWRATAAGSTGSGSALQLGVGVVTDRDQRDRLRHRRCSAPCPAASPVGLVLGALFGLARALPVLGLARTHDRAGLHRLFRRLERWAPRAERLAQAGLATGAAALVAVAAVAATRVGGS